MKAMILAAGRGSRIRPLSDQLPKPLFKVGKYTLIERHLLALQKIGITQVVINVCHLAQQIMDFLGDGQRYGVNISYSDETGNLLETGGGIFRALPLLGEQPFLLISSDIITDFPLENLYRVAIERSNNHPSWLAHLVLVSNPDFNPNGDFGLDDTGYLTCQMPKMTYANLAVLHPRLFDGCQPTHFPLAPLLFAASEKRAISGECYVGHWDNIGTLQQLNHWQQHYVSEQQ
jgi:MurNAc alpha-1-phosphate uridylyltransferase